MKRTRGTLEWVPASPGEPAHHKARVRFPSGARPWVHLPPTMREAETPRQLIGEARVPVAAKPGRLARFDYEYVRNGTANVFVFVDVHRPWRHAKVISWYARSVRYRSLSRRTICFG